MVSTLLLLPNGLPCSSLSGKHNRGKKAVLHPSLTDYFLIYFTVMLFVAVDEGGSHLPLLTHPHLQTTWFYLFGCF